MTDEIKKVMESDELAVAEETIKEHEIVSAVREAVISGIGDVVIKHPNSADEVEISLFYKKRFTHHLREGGLMTKKGLLKSLKNSGEWTDEDERAIEELNKKIKFLSQRIEDCKNIAEKDKFTKEMNTLRKESLQKQTIINSVMNNTVEGQADHEALLYKIFLCTKTKGGAKLAENHADFISQYDDRVINELIYTAQLFWSGVDVDFFAHYLEQIAGSEDIKPVKNSAKKSSKEQ